MTMAVETTEKGKGREERGTDLGAETLGERLGGEALDVLLALLDDDEGEDGDVVSDDAASDRLALALTGAAGAVA